MLVVVPTGGKMVSLVDINTPKMKDFRMTIKNLEAIKFTDVPNHNYATSLNSAIIHKVGNYSISVIYDINDLDSKIVWNYFKKPSDYDTRVNTIKNTTLFPFIQEPKGAVILVHMLL